MLTVRPLLLAGVAAGVAGCSVHPLPDDVTRKKTFEIVESIRCEARAAITGALVTELENWETSRALGRQVETGDVPVQAFVARYDAGSYAAQIGPVSRARIANYRKAEIGFDFSFDIEEKNDHTVGAGLVDALSFGHLNIDLIAGDLRERENTRTFRVSGSFENYLTDKVLIGECVFPYQGKENLVYPITGRIGLDEVVSTFLHIAEYSGFERTGNFKDVIRFKTSYYGGVDPKITISSTSTALRFDNAGGHVRADRIDDHQVTVAVAFPPPPGKKNQASAKPSAETATAHTEVNRILDEEKFFGIQRDVLKRLDELNSD